MPKKIPLYVTSAVILVALSAFAYPVVKNRYFTPAAQQPTATPMANQEATPNSAEPTEEPLTPEESLEIDSVIGDEATEPADPADEATTPEDLADEQEAFLDVVPSDCKQSCKTFDEAEDIEYCKQVCGLAPIKKWSGKCEDLSDNLETDYCLKDQALSQQNVAICKQITDSNLQKTCQNRLMEDALEKNNTNQ